MTAIRHALKALLRTPGFALTVILTLATGIAAVGAMFAIVYAVLLAPLPYGEPDRLVSIGLQTPDTGRIGQPPALQRTYTEFARTLDGVGLHRTGSSNIWSTGHDDVAQSVIATWITASVVPLLRVSPVLGRAFTAEEELRGGPDAVILSEYEWRTRFDAAPDVIGKTLMVNSVAREIVGVMPASFSFPTAETRIWLPAKRVDGSSVGEFIYAGVARLAPGATTEQAQRELVEILPRMAESFPRLGQSAAEHTGAEEPEQSTAGWLAKARPTPVVVPLHDALTGDIAGMLWMLAAAAALVLLVAWANVANLLLIRADARQAELAIRAALGAGRLRTASHALAEALVLGASAGAMALLWVYAAVEALVAFGPTGVPRLAELDVGLPVLAFLALNTAAGVLLCASVPAVRFWRARLPHALHDGGRGSSPGRSRLRLRALLTTLQIAVALAVTISSALLLRSAHGLYRVDPGFDATQVTTLRTQLPFARYDDAAAVAFYARLIEQVRQLPSVHSAGLTMKLPLGSGATLEQAFEIELEQRTRTLPVHVVDDGYFAAMSIPLLAGHGFRGLELERGTDILISRQAAATLFGDPLGSAAVGRRLKLAPAGPDYSVIGVVGDVRDQDLAIAPVSTVYRPLVVPVDPSVEPGTRRNMALVVRAGGPAGPLVAAIRQIVHGLDRSVAIYDVESMRDVVRASQARLSLVLMLMTAAAAITLLLGTIGLYALMAYMVALRTREFGVRVAMGAHPQRIVRLVLARALLLTASGLAAGFALYALTAPFLRSFLFGIALTDAPTLAGATLVLVATATLASWLPALRAARVDPAVALRSE